MYKTKMKGTAVSMITFHTYARISRVISLFLFILNHDTITRYGNYIEKLFSEMHGFVLGICLL